MRHNYTIVTIIAREINADSIIIDEVLPEVELVVFRFSHGCEAHFVVMGRLSLGVEIIVVVVNVFDGGRSKTHLHIQHRHRILHSNDLFVFAFAVLVEFLFDKFFS